MDGVGPAQSSSSPAARKAGSRVASRRVAGPLRRPGRAGEPGALPPGQPRIGLAHRREAEAPRPAGPLPDARGSSGRVDIFGVSVVSGFSPPAWLLAHGHGRSRTIHRLILRPAATEHVHTEKQTSCSLQYAPWKNPVISIGGRRVTLLVTTVFPSKLG